MYMYTSIFIDLLLLFINYIIVAQMVLSATAMIAPPMVNTIKRTFPYANLSDLSFIEV